MLRRATQLAQDAGDQEIATDFCRKPLKQNPLLCWTIQSARSLAATMQVIFLEFQSCRRNRQLSVRGQATFVRVVDRTEERRFSPPTRIAMMGITAHIRRAMARCMIRFHGGWDPRRLGFKPPTELGSVAGVLPGHVVDLVDRVKRTRVFPR